MRKQKKQEDYWDKYKDYNLNLSLNKSDCNEFGLDLFSFNNEKKVIIKNSKEKKGTYKSLKDNNRKVLLKNNKRILKLI